MRILFLCHAFNSLSQRLYSELGARGHQLSIEFDITDSVAEEAVALFRPELIIAPYLRRAIPASIWQRHLCLVVHPGIIVPKRNLPNCSATSTASTRAITSPATISSTRRRLRGRRAIWRSIAISAGACPNDITVKPRLPTLPQNPFPGLCFWPCVPIGNC